MTNKKTKSNTPSAREMYELETSREDYKAVRIRYSQINIYFDDIAFQEVFKRYECRADKRKKATDSELIHIAKEIEGGKYLASWVLLGQ